MVELRRHNLIESYRQLGTFDVVFCRNMVCSFEPDTAGETLRRIADLMPDDGVLFLGAGEQATGAADAFQPADGAPVFIAAPPAPSRLAAPPADHRSAPFAAPHWRPSNARPRGRAKGSWTMNVTGILDRKKSGRDVATTRPEVTIKTVCDRLRLDDIGALVVVDGDHRIVGLVSERQIVRAVSEHGAYAPELRVREIMTEHVVTCTPDDDVAHLMDLMTRHRARHLPVIEEGRLAGIVSIGDVVKYRLDELRLEARVLRDAYIVAR